LSEPVYSRGRIIFFHLIVLRQVSVIGEFHRPRLQGKLHAADVFSIGHFDLRGRSRFAKNELLSVVIKEFAEIARQPVQEMKPAFAVLADVFDVPGILWLAIDLAIDLAERITDFGNDLFQGVIAE